MAFRENRGMDEKSMRTMREVFMQRVRSGLILDALIHAPAWRRQRKITWPCEVWVLYKENQARDIAWLYNKFLSELKDGGVRENDIKLKFLPLTPDEATESQITKRAQATETISIKEIEAAEIRREGRA